MARILKKDVTIICKNGIEHLVFVCSHGYRIENNLLFIKHFSDIEAREIIINMNKFSHVQIIGEFIQKSLVNDE